MAQFDVSGGVDPLVRVTLAEGERIDAERDALVAMDDNVKMEGKMRGGFFKSLARKFLNDETFFQQSFVAEKGEGEVLLAPRLPGDVAILEVGERQYMLADGSYLASTEGVTFETKTQGLGRALLGGSGGLFLMATEGSGRVAVSGFGSLRRIDVKPGRGLVIDNGHLVAWDRTLEYSVAVGTGSRSIAGKLLNSQLSGEGFVLHFKGEGAVWVASRNGGNFIDWICGNMPQREKDA